MTKEAIAKRLALAEESFRRAQQGTCWVRYQSALAALREVEALAMVVVQAESFTTSEEA